MYVEELLTKLHAFKGGVLKRIDVLARQEYLKQPLLLQGDQAYTKVVVVVKRLKYNLVLLRFSEKDGYDLNERGLRR